MSNYYHRITDPYRAIDPNYLQHYNVYGVPIMAYMFIGATTILLAAVTLIESDSNGGESIFDSFTANLPSFSDSNTEISNNISNVSNDISNSIKDAYDKTKSDFNELDDSAKDMFDKTKEAINIQSGGKRKSKKAKKAKKSKKSKKSKKTKRH